MKDISLTAVFQKADEGGYIAYIEELSAVMTQGETIKEAEENLYDALELYLEPHEMPNQEFRNQNVVLRKPVIELSRIA